MAKRRRQPGKRQRGDPSGEGPAEITLLLCTADAALGEAWSKSAAPAGFRLQSAPCLAPEHLAGGEAHLVLVDAAAAAVAEGPLAEALDEAVRRCVWTGTARQIDGLGPARIREAYDVLVTPTSPALVGQKLEGWARNIQQTAALEEIGRRVDSLAEENQRLAARIAEVAAESENFARQHERLDRILRRVRQVARVSREINSLDLDQIVQACIERLPALVDAARASFYLYDAAGDRLTLQGQSPGHTVAARVDLAENPRSPMAAAVRSGEPLLIEEFDEFQQKSDVVVEREYPEGYETRSCIIVPLKGGGRVRGILNLADKRGGGRFDEDVDLPVVEQIAELIGASVYNVELYQEMERRAKTDPLTGLANRRAIEEALAHETDRSRRYGSKLTVLMIDVDHLKLINDRYGHETGDAVLRNLASIIAETVRSVDVPGRWTGGDEFLVVLPDTSAAQAERLARRLLDRIQEQPVLCAEQRLVTSLSIGVAEFRRDESPGSLIHRVDQAMYAAKQGGRNRIATDDGAAKA